MNAIFTDIGIIPCGAESLTPSLEINHGRFEATHVPIPIIRVCTINP